MVRNNGADWYKAKTQTKGKKCRT